MKTLQLALQAWREAERRIQRAGTAVTPEMVQELADAKRRYEKRAAELWGHVPPVPPDPYREAVPGASEMFEPGIAGRARAAGE